jgi:hypothetical protein
MCYKEKARLQRNEKMTKKGERGWAKRV